ncbi:MAG: metallophosphoesterase, partial [Candidatus Neomarinimicrobiota bacterium]
MKRIKLYHIFIMILGLVTLVSAEKYPAKDYLKIVTIFTNDIHGGIDRSEASFINPDFPPMLGGGAVAGRYIYQKRQEAEKNGWGFLLIDAGDFYQGTPMGTLSEGEAVIEYMNAVGYDVLTVGNHDFDNGWKNLKKLSEMANFPFLASNLYRQST